MASGSQRRISRYAVRGRSWERSSQDSFRFATLTGDIQLVEEARSEAERIVREDRGLLKAENAPLRMALKDMRSGQLPSGRA